MNNFLVKNYITKYYVDKIMYTTAITSKASDLIQVTYCKIIHIYKDIIFV